VDRMPSTQLKAERQNILRRLKSQAVADADVHTQAVTELARRLVTWHGLAEPAHTRDMDPEKLPVVVRAHPMEWLIVRAISASENPATFGVMSDGSVFTTDANGQAVFVSGLSALLDEATDVFRHLAIDTAGRFFEHDRHFSLADGTVFLQFGESATMVALRRLKSGVSAWLPKIGFRSSPSEGRRLLVDSPTPGVLKQMGYQVGNDGWETARRRAILKQVFEAELVATSSGANSYVREWGAPGSRQRLVKMTDAIAAFARNAGRQKADFTQAIADWEQDLAWLRATYRSN
jgi:hypothetical protein